MLNGSPTIMHSRKLHDAVRLLEKGCNLIIPHNLVPLLMVCTTQKQTAAIVWHYCPFYHHHHHVQIWLDNRSPLGNRYWIISNTNQAFWPLIATSGKVC